MNDESNEELEQIGEEVGDLMTQEEGMSEDIAGGGIAEALADPPNQGGEDNEVNVDLIMDLPLEMVVEFGRTKMLINDLLQIGQGSVIELNKTVGDPLDILVNGKLVARGEVVVVKDKFGVRITEVLSTIERIKQLS